MYVPQILILLHVCAKRLLFTKINKGLSAKVYTLEIYPLLHVQYIALMQSDLLSIIGMQFSSPWDQSLPSPLTTLRSSSLTLERMLLVVSLLSSVTLTVPVVEVLLTTMVMEH